MTTYIHSQLITRHCLYAYLSRYFPSFHLFISSFSLMEARILAKFERMERHRLAGQARLQGHADARLNQQPTPEAWSVIQLIFHLISAESSSCEYLRRKLPNRDAEPKATLGTWFRFALLQGALYSDFLKFKAPEMTVREIPTNDVSLADALARWDAVRAELKELVATVEAENASKTIFKHPRAGKLTIGQMLAFMDTHQQRHFKQMQQRLK